MTSETDALLDRLEAAAHSYHYTTLRSITVLAIVRVARAARSVFANDGDSCRCDGCKALAALDALADGPIPPKPTLPPNERMGH